MLVYFSLLLLSTRSSAASLTPCNAARLAFSSAASFFLLCSSHSSSVNCRTGKYGLIRAHKPCSSSSSTSILPLRVPLSRIWLRLLGLGTSSNRPHAIKRERKFFSKATWSTAQCAAAPIAPQITAPRGGAALCAAKSNAPVAAPAIPLLIGLSLQRSLLVVSWTAATKKEVGGWVEAKFLNKMTLI